MRSLPVLFVLAATARLCVAAPEIDPAEVQRAADLNVQALAAEHGESVPRDPQRAVALYCESARLGNSDAQYNLGWMYANGRGVARDDGQAAALFRLAAEKGHTQAANMLARVSGDHEALPECMSVRDELVKGAGGDELLVSDDPMRKRIIELVRRLAPDYQVDPRLALAVMATESNFNAQAQSPKKAQGLMQLIPETANRFNVRNSFDPVQNIKGGLAYLRWLLAYFEGDVDLTLAGYNAGEGAVDKYRGVPPYQETRAYVQRIRGVFRAATHPFDGRVTDPSPALADIARKRRM
ncbi:MAG: transglycosylase SLT domain-containing protein [Rhodocyclaceae bacterium]|nr:transglycosylase SLT domain-containing protein [Rhodocyclaceae bacterium]MBX3667622.1 transglycosylase SLT domain-containing protein [Rhodocyclaceae bacterium]